MAGLAEGFRQAMSSTVKTLCSLPFGKRLYFNLCGSPLKQAL